jgi:hypothetical protein
MDNGFTFSCASAGAGPQESSSICMFSIQQWVGDKKCHTYLQPVLEGFLVLFTVKMLLLV